MRAIAAGVLFIVALVLLVRWMLSRSDVGID